MHHGQPLLVGVRKQLISKGFGGGSSPPQPLMEELTKAVIPTQKHQHALTGCLILGVVLTIDLGEEALGPRAFAGDRCLGGPISR